MTAHWKTVGGVEGPTPTHKRRRETRPAIPNPTGPISPGTNQLPQPGKPTNLRVGTLSVSTGSPPDSERYAAELARHIAGSPWLVDVLEVVAASGLPDGWVGAGVIRDLVWDERFGSGFSPSGAKDVDVAFFDAEDLSSRRDQEAERVLKSVRPDIRWDAKNQAAVHLWYPSRFGIRVPTLVSTLDGVDTWPETATAVAVRLRSRELDVHAAAGLHDLLRGIWRRNSRRVTVNEYLARIERKRPHDRWPSITVLGPDD